MPKIGNKTNVLKKGIKVEVEESSTEIAAADENREGIEVINDSGAKIYLGFGTAAILHTGAYLAPGGTWDGKNGGGPIWYGSVFGIATAAKSVVTVWET